LKFLLFVPASLGVDHTEVVGKIEQETVFEINLDVSELGCLL
jgi:hypothetical protein